MPKSYAQFPRSLLLLVSLFFALTNVEAYVFDWTGRTFTGLSTTYTNVDGSGVDVTVSFSGDTSRFVSGYPTVSSAFEIDRALDIYADFQNRTQGITVRVEFNYPGGASAPVTGLTTQVFDMDTGNTSTPTTYRDQIRNVRGTTLGGSSFGSTLTSSNHDITNNGTASATATARIANGTLPDNDPAGTVDIDFGSSQGWRYEITYGNINNSTVQTNPAQQAIGLGDFSFIVVPELSAAVLGLLLVVFCAGHRRRCFIAF